MRPARALFPLLTVAAAGVGVASGQFTTSTVSDDPDLAPRRNDAATLAAREQETIRRVITRTIIGNGRPQPTEDSNNNNSTSDDDDDDDDDDDNTSNRRPTQPPTRNSTPPAATSSAAAAATTFPTTTTTNNNNNNGLSAGAAAGITAAAVAGAVIIAAIAFLVWRRRQGGIRGAVVTGDYPRSMGGGSGNRSNRGMEDDGEPKMLPPVPPPPPPMAPGVRESYGDGAGYGYGYGEGVGYAARGVEEQDLGEGRRSGGSGGSEVPFRPPPAGTMMAESQVYEMPQGGYPPLQQQEQQRPQLWLGGDLGEPRPVSAFTVYPSPGPILPVSPMTPYRPESSILTSGQHPQPRVSSYYPDPSSPGPPAFLIPGGNRARAMSFSSVSHVGGGPRTAELVGSPPPPIPSMMVIVEGDPSTRQSRAEMR